MLNKVKQSLRISATTTSFDDEINDLIDQCKDDLKSSGIIETKLLDVTIDGNISRLIILYCKAFFGLENPDKDWYFNQYKYKKAETLNQSSYKSGDSNV